MPTTSRRRRAATSWTGKASSSMCGSRCDPEPGADIVMKITAATILIIALATAAEATTVRVGPAERCTTIAAGIAAAQAGDTVRVAGGLYNAVSYTHLRAHETP